MVDKYYNIFEFLLKYDVEILLRPSNHNISFTLKLDKYHVDIYIDDTDKEIKKNLKKFFRKIKLKRIKCIIKSWQEI